MTTTPEGSAAQAQPPASPSHVPQGAPADGAPRYGSMPVYSGGSASGRPVPLGPLGKVRNPFAVFLLSFITFGIYYLYWHFTINEELAAYDRRIEVTPVLSLLAQFVPVVSLVSVWNTGSRVRSAQGFSGRYETCSGGLGTLLCLVILGNTFYYQTELNNLWRSYQN